MRILFSDENLDGIYNSQNDRIWAIIRGKVNQSSRRKQQGKFAEKVMVWLAVCLENVVPLFYLEKVLSIITVTSRKHYLLFYDTETVNLETTEALNETTEHDILTKERKSGVPTFSIIS